MEEHYKNKSIRMAEKTWEQLKERRKKLGKSWNLFLLDLLKKNELNKNKIVEGNETLGAKSVFGGIKKIS
jgi:hypothetical protein